MFQMKIPKSVGDSRCGSTNLNTNIEIAKQCSDLHYIAINDLISLPYIPTTAYNDGTGGVLRELLSNCSMF